MSYVFPRFFVSSYFSLQTLHVSKNLSTQTYFGIAQEHSDGLSSRLRQRDEELAEAANLMTETQGDLTALRNRAQETEKVTDAWLPQQDSSARPMMPWSTTARLSTVTSF